MDEARALATRLAAGPSFALGMTKTLLNQELDTDFARGDRGRGPGAGDLHADARPSARPTTRSRRARGTDDRPAASSTNGTGSCTRASRTLRRDARSRSPRAGKRGDVDEAGARRDPHLRRARALPAAGPVGRRRRRARPARVVPDPRSAGRGQRPGRRGLRRAGPRQLSDRAERQPRDGGERYLPRVATARRSPRSRSPSPRPAPTRRRIATRARTDGDDYVLDGTKIFISNATIASLLHRVRPDRDGPKRAISAFVVDAGHAGRDDRAPAGDVGAAPDRGTAASTDAVCRPSSGSARKGDGMRLALGDARLLPHQRRRRGLRPGRRARSPNRSPARQVAGSSSAPRSPSSSSHRRRSPTWPPSSTPRGCWSTAPRG